MIVAMPREGAIIFSDLIGKVDIYASVAPRAGGMVAMDCPASLIAVAAMPSLSIGSMNLQPSARRRLRTT
jgi:hypothetical protein